MSIQQLPLELRHMIVDLVVPREARLPLYFVGTFRIRRNRRVTTTDLLRSFAAHAAENGHLSLLRWTMRVLCVPLWEFRYERRLAEQRNHCATVQWLTDLHRLYVARRWQITTMPCTMGWRFSLTGAAAVEIHYTRAVPTSNYLMQPIYVHYGSDDRINAIDVKTNFAIDAAPRIYQFAYVELPSDELQLTLQYGGGDHRSYYYYTTTPATLISSQSAMIDDPNTYATLDMLSSTLTIAIRHATSVTPRIGSDNEAALLTE